MANTRKGNIHYVDTAATLVSTGTVKVVHIIVTATSANAIVEIADPDGDVLLDLDVATAKESHHFDFSGYPLIFPSGLRVETLTNAIVTLIYSS